MSYEYLMFEAANVEDHFRVSNLVIGYSGWVWLPCDMASRHVFRCEQPALEYQTRSVTMILRSNLCVVLEGEEKITPLSDSRNL